MKTTKQQNYLLIVLVAALFADIYLWWPEKPVQITAQGTGAEAMFLPLLNDYTQPIPRDMKFDAHKVALGKKLFHDPRLSADNTISCASCHKLSSGGTDNLQYSVGIQGGVGEINAPTVLNSVFNFVQFWNGRAATLEDQIDGPVTHPKEMGTTWDMVLQKLNADSAYKESFAAVYPDKSVSVRNIKDAIATFERSLVTPNSRFDQYLRGDTAALSPTEIQGFELFKSYGCISCHQGVNLGGNMYERFGLMADYFGDRGNVTYADYGRFNVTGKEEDRYLFRVPSLRNVALTAPYFHDGTAHSLPEAVKVMAKYQLGLRVSDGDTGALVAFLYSLTAEEDLERLAK